MNRRNFFGLFAAAAATAIVVPELDLLVPKRTLFLPPVGGWIGRGNHLLSPKVISDELLRIFNEAYEHARLVDREYRPTFSEANAFERRSDGVVMVRGPPRYHKDAFQFTTADLGSAPNDRITFGGKSWPS